MPRLTYVLWEEVCPSSPAKQFYGMNQVGFSTVREGEKCLWVPFPQTRPPVLGAAMACLRHPFSQGKLPPINLRTFLHLLVHEQCSHFSLGDRGQLQAWTIVGSTRRVRINYITLCFVINMECVCAGVCTARLCTSETGVFVCKRVHQIRHGFGHGAGTVGFPPSCRGRLPYHQCGCVPWLGGCKSGVRLLSGLEVKGGVCEGKRAEIIS